MHLHNLSRALLALVVLPLMACGGEPPAPPETYQARGIVRQIGGGETPELLIHHESLPDFRNDKGETVGMDSMAMPFPAAQPALVEGLAVGDRIAFTFEVRWEDGPPLRLTHVEPLGPDVRLEFERPTTEPAGGGEDTTEPDATDHDHEGMHGTETPADGPAGATTEGTPGAPTTEGSEGPA